MIELPKIDETLAARKQHNWHVTWISQLNVMLLFFAHSFAQSLHKRVLVLALKRACYEGSMPFLYTNTASVGRKEFFFFPPVYTHKHTLSSAKHTVNAHTHWKYTVHTTRNTLWYTVWFEYSLYSLESISTTQMTNTIEATVYIAFRAERVVSWISFQCICYTLCSVLNVFSNAHIVFEQLFFS